MKPSRRATDRPIHVRFQDRGDTRLRKREFPQRLRCGYSNNCELCLTDGKGPDLLFELSREGSALQFSTRLTPERLRSYVDVTVDGESIKESERRLRPGSRLDVSDRDGRRQYSLVVDMVRPWFIRRKFLAVTLLLLTLTSGLYGGYVYTVLTQAQQQLVITEQRLARAEADMVRTQSRIRDTLRRLESTESQLSGAIKDLKRLQEASSEDIRREFDRRLSEISSAARQNLARLSEEDTRAREQLERETRDRISNLRHDFSSKMVETYQNFKDLEGRLFRTVESELASMEPEGEVFKRILHTTRDGVVFIHTRYKVEIVRSGEISEYNSFGTGFLISEDGRGLTAQHVLFPWLYEREFLMLNELGLVKLVPDSQRWSMWLTGATVYDDEDEQAELSARFGYRSDQDDRGLRFLYSPPLNVSEELASTPAGMVMIPIPVPDGSDIAVFQLMDFDASFKPLELAKNETEPLDDMLAVGYPFSRLREGVAIPQAVRGFVRMVSQNVMELDTSLHPGLSGGPIMNRGGQVIGMAMAIFQSDVYGLAVNLSGLQKALEEAEKSVRRDETRLSELGCDPGRVDGRIDRQTQAAYRCEKKKIQAATPPPETAPEETTADGKPITERL